MIQPEATPKIPDRIYGRRREIELLAKTNVVLSLIKGPSGIGKSRLVNAVRSKLLGPKGRFYLSKLDAYSNARPYAGIAPAMEKMASELLEGPPDQVESSRNRLREAIGLKGKLLCQYISNLELIVREMPKIPVQADESSLQLDLQQQFIRFFQALVPAERPVLLFVDDLQWADLASLNIIAKLVIKAPVPGLNIIAAYRAEEVSESLRHFIEHLESSRASYQCIEVPPLGPDAISELLTDIFGEHDVTGLAQIVHEKSGGNPLFIDQILGKLAREGALYWMGGSWHCDLQKVVAAGIESDVLPLLIEKIQSLNPYTIEVLKWAACSSGPFSTDFLANLTSQSLGLSTAVNGALREAGKEALVLPIAQNDRVFAFAHDKIREAVYDRIDSDFRENAHFAISAYLQKAPNYEAVDVAEQLRLAPHRVAQQPERHPNWYSIAVGAGAIARQAKAYDKATQFLEFALTLNVEQRNPDHYRDLGTSYLAMDQVDRYLALERIILADAHLSERDLFRCLQVFVRYKEQKGKKKEVIRLASQLFSRHLGIELGNFEERDLPFWRLSFSAKKFIRLVATTDPSLIFERTEEPYYYFAYKSLIDCLAFEGHTHRVALFIIKMFFYELQRGALNKHSGNYVMACLVSMRQFALARKLAGPWIASFEGDHTIARMDYLINRINFLPHILDLPQRDFIEVGAESDAIAIQFDDRYLHFAAQFMESLSRLDYSIDFSFQRLERIYEGSWVSTNEMSIQTTASVIRLIYRLRYGDDSKFSLRHKLPDELTMIFSRDVGGKYASRYYGALWLAYRQDWKAASELYRGIRTAFPGFSIDYDFRHFYAICGFRSGTWKRKKVKAIRSTLGKLAAFSPKHWGHQSLLMEADWAYFVQHHLARAIKLYDASYCSASQARAYRSAAFILELTAAFYREQKHVLLTALFAKESIEAWRYHGSVFKSSLNERLFGAELVACDLLGTSKEHQQKLRLERDQLVERCTIKTDQLRATLLKRAIAVTAMLQNISSGIFLFGEDLICKAEYSQNLTKLIGLAQPMGLNVVEVLLEDLGPDQRNTIQSFLRASIGFDRRMDWDVNAHLLPRLITRYGQRLEVDWMPITEQDRVTEVLVVVRDTTQTQTLTRKAEKRRRILSILKSLHHTGAGRVHAFLNSTLWDNLGEPRNLHTIKGNARTLGLTDIADAAHRAEGGASKEHLLEVAKHRMNVVFLLSQLTPQITNDLKTTVQSLPEIVETIKSSLGDLAQELGKPIPKVLYDEESELSCPPALLSAFQNVLIHVFRNSLDHGIELPAERVARGKPPEGAITVKAASGSLCVQDDGGGLDLIALRQKAGRSLSDAEAAATIFEAGVSTASAITLISGRGVGMDAVKKFVEDAGGTVRIRFTSGEEGTSRRCFSLDFAW